VVEIVEKYSRNPDFIFRKIVDEAVLVPIHQNVADMDCLYTLNDVGAFIWDQLETPRTKDDLLAAILNEYAADPQVLLADLDRFIAEMTAIGSLQTV
jgi:hypothetical protein